MSHYIAIVVAVSCNDCPVQGQVLRAEYAVGRRLEDTNCLTTRLYCNHSISEYYRAKSLARIMTASVIIL